MKVVALTGGIGCGKTEATRTFETLGVPVVDLDVISHALTAVGSPMLGKLKEVFGAEYVTIDGALDRAKMRELIFNQPEARAKLNAIMHPAIFEQAIQALKSLKHDSYQVLAIPLLQESQRYMPYIHHVLVIDCDPQIQLQRVMLRTGLSKQAVTKMIEAQASRQSRLAIADTVIENNGDLPNLREKIAQFHKNYINTCIVSK